MNSSLNSGSKVWRLTLISSLFLAAHVHAQTAAVTDAHGNEGYASAAECDAAVAAGTAKFYQPYTHQPQHRRAGEADVKVVRLGDLEGYAKGSCDLGVGRRDNRDGVGRKLIGTYVPFSPEMSVNAYLDAQARVVRVTMQQCDNNFHGDMPRPMGVQVAASQCFVSVLTPAKFETRTEQVVKVAETKRYESVPPTFKTVTEEVIIKPEMKRQIAVPATYKEVSEQVLVRPESLREEPIPATYKMVAEQLVISPPSTRIELEPGTFKTVSEKVMVSPERKNLKVIAATYADKEESLVDRPSTTRVETVPATFKTETERVLLKAESVRYEPIELPLRTVKEEVIRSEASSKLHASKSAVKTETEQVLVKEASKRLIEVPAVYEVVTDNIKIADATREWKRGKAWVGKALNVRPLRGFVVGKDGRVDGATVDTQGDFADNTRLDDDVMCLVEIPAKYQLISRQVLKAAASVREETIPAQYATVKRQVLAKEAATDEVDIPATYQSVSHQVIDVEKLRSMGFKFDASGDIVATPSGERVLRAASVAGLANAEKSEGAQSGMEGYVREIQIPAQYQTISRRVVDQPAAVRTVEIPATYKTVKTRVVDTPATTEEVTIPAVFESVTREVVDKAPSTREIVIPAVYRTVERKVVDQPASTRKIAVAPEYETVKRRVIDQPATFREEVIPAVTQVVSHQVIERPASVREITVPAQYETLSHQVKVAEGNTEQRAILCETNATPAKIAEIQRALSKAGYAPGPLDGRLRAQTMHAVNRYQQANGLPVDGFLNLETVKALGVSPN
jgi:hypothetical protein